MKQSNKIRLANLTTWTMIVTISLIALFFIGFVTSQTFDLNVFTSRTSEFIFSFIGFAAVLIACSAILNISLNISLIADSKIVDVSDNEKNETTRKFIAGVAGVIVVLVGFLFVGDYLTRESEKEKILEEANDIISRYNTSIDKIFAGLADTSKVKDIPEILKFLSNQKQEFPSVSLLLADKFDGQLAFLEVNEWDSPQELKKPFFGGSFYKCELQDCSYLEGVFTGKTNDKHLWTEKNDYRLYFPFIKNNKKFILLFTKYQRYGKIGSR